MQEPDAALPCRSHEIFVSQNIILTKILCEGSLGTVSGTLVVLAAYSSEAGEPYNEMSGSRSPALESEYDEFYGCTCNPNTSPYSVCTYAITASYGDDKYDLL